MKKLFVVLALFVSATASAYTEADITYNSVCGAAGIGKQFSPTATRAKDEIHYRDPTPKHRVNENGYWTSGCKMPVPVKVGCTEMVVPPWRGKNGWGYCTPAKYSILHAHKEGVRQQVVTPSKPASGGVGSQTWKCVKKEDGTFEWIKQKSYCTPGK